MPATAAATGTAFEMIVPGHHHQALLEIIVFLRNRFHRHHYIFNLSIHEDLPPDVIRSPER